MERRLCCLNDYLDSRVKIDAMYTQCQQACCQLNVQRERRGQDYRQQKNSVQIEEVEVYCNLFAYAVWYNLNTISVNLLNA